MSKLYLWQIVFVADATGSLNHDVSHDIARLLLHRSVDNFSNFKVKISSSKWLSRSTKFKSFSLKHFTILTIL